MHPWDPTAAIGTILSGLQFTETYDAAFLQGLAPPFVSAPDEWLGTAVANRGGIYFLALRLGSLRAVAWAAPWSGIPYRDGGPQENPASPRGRTLERATAFAGFAFRSREDGFEARGWRLAVFPGFGDEPLRPFRVHHSLAHENPGCTFRRIPVTVGATLVTPQGALAAEGGALERLPIGAVRLDLPRGGGEVVVSAPIFHSGPELSSDGGELVQLILEVLASAGVAGHRINDHEDDDIDVILKLPGLANDAPKNSVFQPQLPVAALEALLLLRNLCFHSEAEAHVTANPRALDALVAAARVDHPGGGEIILFSLTGAVADAKVRALPPPRHARCRAVRVAV